MNTSSGQIIGRTELLAWINSVLDLSIKRIEDLGTGCVYLQLLDLAFPDTKIPLSKLNWAAKQECEILTNLRLLNSWMERLKVGRVLDIDKIAKCKYQDNLETIQWFKRYIDMHVKQSQILNYMPKERRNKGDQKLKQDVTTLTQVNNKLIRIKEPRKLNFPSIGTGKQADAEVQKDMRRIEPFDDPSRKLREVENIILEEGAIQVHDKFEMIKQILFPERKSMPPGDQPKQITGKHLRAYSSGGPNQNQNNISVQNMSSLKLTSFTKMPAIKNNGCHSQLYPPRHPLKGDAPLSAQSDFNLLAQSACKLPLPSAADGTCSHLDHTIQEIPIANNAHFSLITRSHPNKEDTTWSAVGDTHSVRNGNSL